MVSLLVVLACRTPVGVERVDPQRVHRGLTANVLSTGKPSAPASQVLHRDDLTERFASDPAAALASLRERWVKSPGPRRLFGLSELSFVHAQNGGGRPYYLAAAIYAYAYLFPPLRGEAPGPFDPRFRLAADLYNRGITDGLLDASGAFVDLSARTLALPFGELVLESDPSSFLWANHQLEDFVPVAELEVRGLSSRFRRPGLGAPLAARVGERPEGLKELEYDRWRPRRARVPATAVVRIASAAREIQAGRVTGRLELYVATGHESVEIGGRQVPLEYEPTAVLAYSLEKAQIWDMEIAGFLGRGVDLGVASNLVMLEPHERGKIPVVLVHGTASSPARWAEMINELGTDPRLKPYYEFWFFLYETGNPILYSANQLRQSLLEATHDLDPQGTDPGLRKLVVIGHSQGGLLSKLQAVDSGERFWSSLSDEPISALGLDPETQELLQAAFFFQAVPGVRRVIFVSTPHGGSFLAGQRVANLAARMVRLPGDVMQVGAALFDEDNRRVLRQKLDRVPSSIDNMTPGNTFLVTLHDTPLADGVSGHSIIAVKSEGPIFDQTDGVVAFESAHIEGVESEKVVISGHSGSQDHPDTVAEVRRILLENLATD